ncbi:MAG: DEAD/DEAH box helicase [Alphaproteobacteria bacterium]|nr:DEAD/DEAH box helicase [Alphaproteobacteria bacterium]
MNFKDLGLSEKTIKAIEEVGIKKPTTVQIDVIPSILEGKDIFAIAPGRCGKTCSYVFPLIEIISRRQGQNILIITADSAQSVVISDRLAVFNKYHEICEETICDNSQEINSEANVIIATPDLLLDISTENKIDFNSINILVVDDINLIKKKHQLANLEQILEKLPAEKQNIVFTNRRSKETQDILDKILKTPAEIKVNKNKEDEAQNEQEQDTLQKEVKSTHKSEPKKKSSLKEPKQDHEALTLAQKHRNFGDKTPAFLLIKGELVRDEYK